MHIIMDKPDLNVQEVRTQYSIKNLLGRSVRLDIHAIDNAKKKYIGLLMHDFACSNPADMHYKILADKTRYFKEDEKGVAAMCKVVEDLCNDAKIEEKKESAIRLLRQGKLSDEEIAEGLGLEVEVVKALEEEQKTVAF